VLAILGIHFETNYGDEPLSKCKLPDPWAGSWFLSGLPEKIIITGQSLGWMGDCYRIHDNNKYIFYRPEDQCFQCVAIWVRHQNALEFKSGECKDSDFTENLCDISPDVTLNTLVRLDGEDIECPFQAPLSFSYSKGTGVCKSPLSELGQCLTSAQVKLRFHACPDISQTESKEEVLTCIATWPDDRDASQTFLVGTLDFRYRRTDEDRLRCFLLRKTSSGFLVAQSSDATCHGGLSSPEDGFQTFQLGSVTPDRGNLFPMWTAQLKRLLTFDFNRLYSFNEDRTTFFVSNYSYTTKESILVSRTTLVQIEENGANRIKMVTKTISGCEQMYRCTILYRRTDDILELEEGLPTRVMRAACAEANFVSSRNVFTTLLKENLEIRKCNLLGVHNVTSLSLDSKTKMCDLHGFSRIEIQCSSREQVEFIRDCPSSDRATYFCQGGWEERVKAAELLPPQPTFPFVYQDNFIFARDDNPIVNDPVAEEVTNENITRGFIIAKPKRRDSNSFRRVCLMYTVINGTFGWTVGKSGCDRNIRPGSVGEHRFNTTVIGPCSGSECPTVLSVIAVISFMFKATELY